MLRFGPFELDPEQQELRRGGLVVRLPRQPFRILLLLVARAGEVVSREEIHDTIWGSETYVDFEHGINSAIRQIRFALGDNAETSRYVRTLPRRGYSFIATVERVARPGESVVVTEEPVVVVPPPPPPRRRIASPRIAAIAGIALLALSVMVALIAESRRLVQKAGVRSIAVQPFRRLGPPIAAFDERSFPEELRARIGRLPRTHVSLTEVPARADVVIDGTIRHAEDGVRVIVSLTDRKSQTRIWSETFQRPDQRRDGMAVEVAYQVTRELARRFLPPPRREPLLETRTKDSAIKLYRRARLLHSRSQGYDWMRTKEMYEAALREEPKFAEAWSGLSDVWATQAMRGPIAECDVAAAHAADAARRAVALQPRNAEAHSTLGLLAAQREYDLATAEDEMRRATAGDPGYVDARGNLAMVLTMRGQVDESLREWTAAQQLDPAGLDLSPVEPTLYMHARRYEDARARYREILAVNPESQAAAWGLMYTYVLQKNWNEALVFAAVIRQKPIENHIPRNEAGFMKIYREFEETLHELRRREQINDYFLGIYYSQLGDKDRAFAMLNKAIDVRVPVVSYILVDPRIDNLRGDPRYRTLLARLKLARPPA